MKQVQRKSIPCRTFGNRRKINYIKIRYWNSKFVKSTRLRLVPSTPLSIWKSELPANVWTLRYIEDITRRCEDMNFIFKWWKQYFTNERSEWVKYCFHHEKIKFISANRRVMFCLLYSRKQFKTQDPNFRSIIVKTWLYFNLFRILFLHTFILFL